MAAVVQLANTFVGKPGNIGVRTARVLDRLDAIGGRAVCVCRGAARRSGSTRYIEMGWLGHVPRLLNAARTYVAPRFNHRPLDIAIFERYAGARLDRVLEAERPQVAHVWDVCPTLIRRLRRDGVRVVLDVPIAPLAYGRRLRASGRADFLADESRLIDIEQAAFLEADVVVAPSAFVAEELRRIGVTESRIEVVEFGSDVPPAAAGAGAAGFGDDGMDFCFMGLVNRRKGVLELLEAWSTPDFGHDRLHLCGRVFPAVTDAIARARGGRVLTPGFVKSFEYLSRCHAFVFPSWMEGSAKAVYEAMACGLPSIVTSSAGAIVRDGVDGFVVEPGDVAALRERMLWIRQNPAAAREMGERARERVRGFSWTRYADRVIDIYARYGWRSPT